MRLKRIRAGEVIICLVLFICSSTNSFWGYRLFHDSNLFAGMACLIPLGMLMISLLRHSERINAQQFLVAAAVYGVILISSRLNPKQVLYYGVCIGLLLYTPVRKYPYMLKAFLFLGLFFAVGSIIYLAFPAFYKQFILPAFSGSSQYDRLTRWANRTSNFIVPGFTNQTPFNACFFAYGIGFLFCWYSGKNKYRVLRLICLALFIICLVLTNKRAHFLFLVIALLGTFLFSATKTQRGRRILMIAAIGTATAVLLLILINYVDIGVFKKLKKMIVSFLNDEDAASGRGDLNALAIRYFLKNPLNGIGWEQFRFIPELDSPLQTHNIYLELLCETGIFGFGVMLFFFVWTLATAIRNCRQYQHGQEASVVRFCLFLQIFFLLYGLTGNPLYDAPYYIPYFLACSYTFSFRRAAYTVPALLARDDLHVPERWETQGHGFMI